MNKILLVIKKEYLQRVRKKSFWIMSLLAPLIFVAISIIPTLLIVTNIEEQKVLVVDESKLFIDKLEGSKLLNYTYSSSSIAEAKKSYGEEGYDGLLYIPKEMSAQTPVDPTLYFEKSLGVNTENSITYDIEDILQKARYKEAGIDPKKLNELEVFINLSTRETGVEVEEEKSTGVASAAGYAGGLLIYLFILLYGNLVMKGVIEEKSNRIVEVMISSIKPFQLMMGKILGISAVAMTQLLLWIGLTFALGSVGTGIVAARFATQETSTQTAGAIAENLSGQKMEDIQAAAPVPQNPVDKVMKSIFSINVPLILFCFIFYFLVGYLLYASMFAAIGAAGDNETDAQQYTLPVTMPLILGFIVSMSLIQNPDGLLGQIMSIFPLTSPITMMVRLPFGVPVWELVVSMLVLLLSFVGITWFASRIYRIGILMYGKKPTWKEIIRWTFAKY